MATYVQKDSVNTQVGGPIEGNGLSLGNHGLVGVVGAFGKIVGAFRLAEGDSVEAQDSVPDPTASDQ